jgi:hypothetical protein
MKDIASYLGESDPEGILKRAAMEKVEIADLNARIELLQRKLSGQYDEDVQAAAREMIEQLQQQAVEQQAAEEEGATGEVPRPAPGPRGRMFDPSRGGTPPSVATPEGATFEGATGTTRAGGGTEGTSL